VKELTMTATILLVACALGQAQPEKTVTDAEKTAFLKLLATLPTEREFYTEEAVKKAVPYTRVLLALTEKDLKEHGIYPFLALSAGLMGHKEARQYAAANFARIAHPTLKLSWAIMLFRLPKAPPEVVPFLRKALDSKEAARTISSLLGPGFEDFKDEVIRASETGKLMKVELVKRHSIQVFPKYGGGGAYTNSNYLFAPGPLVYAVRPLNQRGELTTYDITKGNASRRVVPQPQGFKPKYDFSRYFDDPVLSINSRGDLLCRWTIEGNGDHGFALLKKGSDSFLVNRVALALAYWSHVVANSEGAWHLIQTKSGGFFNVYQLDKELRFTRLGRIRRRQSSGLLDAHFLSPDVVHLFSFEENSHGSLRCIDFDVKERKPLHNRALVKLDKFVWPSNGTVLQFKDGALHYLWGIKDLRDGTDAKGKKRERQGLYYQAEADAIPVKLGDGCHHRAIAIGDRIVVCYTREKAPDRVYFRVIRYGAPGPVSAITVAKGREYNLWAEDMVLYAEGDRLWFVNTLMPNTLYELKLVDTKGP
jgi:hypothetical protein